jgi:L-galactose dehydrogenase
MERRPLGSTGLSVSALGFGAAPLGDIFGPVDEAVGARAVAAALDCGIDYFDTAPLYGFGLAEERLGRALAKRRKDVVLATKCCRDGFTEFDFSAARVVASVEESMRRLGTDWIDVLQIHDVEFGSRQQVLEEAMPAAMRLKDAGKVRFVGITGLPVRHLRRLAEATQLDTVLSWGHCNLVEDELEEVLLPLAKEQGFGLMSASPLLQGLLTDAAPPAWHRSPAPVLAAAPELAATCRAAGFDLAEVAIRYATSRPGIATTIVGMKDEREVAATVASRQQLVPDELLQRLLQQAEPIRNMMWYEGLAENNVPPDHPSRHVPQPPTTTHS